MSPQVEQKACFVTEWDDDAVFFHVKILFFSSSVSVLLLFLLLSTLLNGVAGRQA